MKALSPGVSFVLLRVLRGKGPQIDPSEELRRVDYMLPLSENTYGRPQRTARSVPQNSGPVAQLGARFHGMEEVVGSIPTRSTKIPRSVHLRNHNRRDAIASHHHRSTGRQWLRWTSCVEHRPPFRWLHMSRGSQLRKDRRGCRQHDPPTERERTGSRGKDSLLPSEPANREKVIRPE